MGADREAPANRQPMVRERSLRDALTTMLEVSGAVVLVTGVCLIYVPAGLIVAGLCCIGIGYFVGGRP